MGSEFEPLCQQQWNVGTAFLFSIYLVVWIPSLAFGKGLCNGNHTECQDTIFKRVPKGSSWATRKKYETQWHECTVADGGSCNVLPLPTDSGDVRRISGCLGMWASWNGKILITKIRAIRHRRAKGCLLCKRNQCLLPRAIITLLSTFWNRRPKHVNLCREETAGCGGAGGRSAQWGKNRQPSLWVSATQLCTHHSDQPSPKGWSEVYCVCVETTRSGQQLNNLV